ncbi:MAG: hypothetical protein HYU86_02865 [Chloroflexi bacterium]|nr:hypothetical protein [Chloroflexota bacterium]
MSKERERELEKAETWDFEQPEVREPVKAPRVVVSVAFRREDFAQVSEYAERVGKRISQFIREVAIEKATGRDVGISVHTPSSSTTGKLWWIAPQTITRVSGRTAELPEKAAATTY